MPVELTAAGSGPYRVRINGVTVAPGHTTEREAMQRCVNWKQAHPGDEVEYYHDYRVFTTLVGETVPPPVIPPPPPPEPEPEPEPIPIPPPTSGAIVFASDFSTGEKTDGGRWHIALSNDQHNVGVIVPGSEAGFPTSHALRVTPNSNQSSLRLLKRDMAAWGENEARGLRFYFRLDHPPIGDNNNHPIETNTQVSSTIAWAFRSNCLSATQWSAQMRISGAVVFETPPLDLHVPYMFEFLFQRQTGLVFNLHARVCDAAGALLHGDSAWRNLNGGGTLADNPALQFAGLEALTSIQVGLNGISNADWHPSMLYGYQGAFCVRAGDWCGPYQPGEGR